MSKAVIEIRDDLLEKVRSITGISRKGDIVNYAFEKLVEQK
jgi:Arc/MetJ family transcription regulator